MPDSRKQMIKAWEKLPMGNHSPKVIESWLMYDMLPAVNAIRAELAEEEHYQEYKAQFKQ